MDEVEAPASVRLAELVAALSLGIDLGFGQPMGHVLRQCRIALRLGDLVRLDEEARATLYYTALLVNVGCHTDAHEQARWWGDDIALKSTKYDHEMGSLADFAATIRMIGSGSPPLHRLRVAFDFATSDFREIDGMIDRRARLARALGEELQLPRPVLEALRASYERWDGKGYPGELSGDDVPVASRITQFAEFLEVAHRSGRIDAAKDLAKRRAGTQFDPNLTAVLCADAEKVFHGIEEVGSWEAVIDAEPALAVQLSPEGYDAALAAIARYVDMKSPYTLGHSNAVAEMAARAVERLGLGSAEVQTLRRAGFVLGFGRLGVSNAIWDKRGPLTVGEWERVRMHPYLTERMLRQSQALAPLGMIVVQHRERLDGSGYPKGLAGAAVSRAARVVGGADAYQAMREPRPHRPALTPEAAARELRAEIGATRMDSESVEAVLDAAGHRTSRRLAGPAGLTAREVEVLRLVARGRSNKDIAAELVITPKTAGNHVEHIYTKIRSLVRGGFVRHYVDVEADRHCLVDGSEEPLELHGPVLRAELMDHLAGGEVESCEQVGDAVADVVVGAVLDLAGAHGQHRLGSVEGLDARLFVHAQHHRLVRRVQVQPHHVAHLLDEHGVLGQLEGVRLPRLTTSTRDEGRPSARSGKPASKLLVCAASPTIASTPRC